MNKTFYFLAALLLLIITCSPLYAAKTYNLMEPDDLKVIMDTKQPVILVDIQKKNAYKEHHFYGSIRTFAYPAKTDTDKDSLVQAVTMYNTNQDKVVIIGPRGGRASKRSYDFLVDKGIPEENMFILKGGIKQWPYKEMLLNIKGGCD